MAVGFKEMDSQLTSSRMRLHLIMFLISIYAGITLSSLSPFPRGAGALCAGVLKCHKDPGLSKSSLSEWSQYVGTSRNVAQKW